MCVLLCACFETDIENSIYMYRFSGTTYTYTVRHVKQTPTVLRTNFASTVSEPRADHDRTKK